ncbi:MAG: hypothetical protein ACRYFK_13750 [Janthinobacterium lividum]
MAGLLLAASPARAQNVVANYALGRPGTASYEHFSFWTKDGRRYQLQYSYGPDRIDATLHYAGPATVGGQASFKVQFADGHVLYITPGDTTLRVAAASKAAPKVFSWEYEGPINGVGTDCSVCTPSAPAAIRLVRTRYLK